MTGAGSAEVAVAEESEGFRTLPESPVWQQLGENIDVGNASLQNALERARQPNDPRPDGSVEGNLEGAYSITFDMTDTNFHKYVFPATSPVGLARSAMLAPTGTWYLSADVLPGTQERFLEGAAVESVSISYQQGQSVTVELTLIYAQEYDAGDVDAPGVPSAISQPAKDDIVRWHGADFQIDSAVVDKLQSLTLDVSGMARFRRDQSRIAADAVVGAYEPSLSVQAILEDDTQRSLAYGSSTATKPADTIDETPGTLTLSNGSGTVAQYNLDGLQPTSYDWADLVSADTDITDPVEYHVKDIQVA